ITWADVKVTQRLQDGYLPIPTVHWQADGLQLDTTAFASGTPDHARLIVQYRLCNARAHARALTLALLVRPFQVNPPTQFLNTPGGISPIRSLRWDGRAVRVNDDLRVVPLLAPDAFASSAHDQITLPQRLRRGE